jgi:excisionase family DNA binding protein
MEKLWTSREVSEFLAVDEATVERLILEGRITGYKVGGKYLRFRPAEVEALKGRVASSQAPTASAVNQGALADGLMDFFYFNDFYLISAFLLVGLVVYLILA